MTDKSRDLPLNMHEIALAKLQKYCAYQDRCHHEVRGKLLALKVYGDDLEEVITELIREDYLNEERFARSYARGKFRMKKWGRIKIRIELKRRQVSPYCIKKGMTEIDEEEYIDTLRGLVIKEMPKHKSLQAYQRRVKLYQFSMRKGYENETINLVLNEILNPK